MTSAKPPRNKPLTLQSVGAASHCQITGASRTRCPCRGRLLRGWRDEFAPPAIRCHGARSGRRRHFKPLVCSAPGHEFATEAKSSERVDPAAGRRGHATRPPTGWSPQTGRPPLPPDRSIKPEFQRLGKDQMQGVETRDSSFQCLASFDMAQHGVHSGSHQQWQMLRVCQWPRPGPFRVKFICFTV